MFKEIKTTLWKTEINSIYTRNLNFPSHFAWFLNFVHAYPCVLVIESGDEGNPGGQGLEFQLVRRLRQEDCDIKFFLKYRVSGRVD